MEQEITISKNIIKYFKDSIDSLLSSVSPKTPDFYNIIDILMRNFVVIDRDKQNSSVILKELDNLFNEEKMLEFKKGFTIYLEKRAVLVSCNLSPDNENFELCLCNSSEDKIYFNPLCTKKELENVKKKIFFLGYNNIELHSLNSFLYPGTNHRFISNNKKVDIVEFKKGRIYKIDTLLKPYVRNSFKIEFIDKYIPNEITMFHLRNIISNCINAKKIILTTASRKDYLLNKNPYLKKVAINNYNKFENLMKIDNRLEFKNINTIGHTERFIITDSFEIQLPGGLDQINKNGYPKIDNENKKLKMFIIKK